MGNILDVLRLYSNYICGKSYNSGNKYLRATRSQNMKKALRAWESRTGSSRKKKSKKGTHSSLALPKRSRRLKAKWPKRTKSYPDKYKILKKHMQEMATKRNLRDDRQSRILQTDIRMRTRGENNAMQRLTQKDFHDPLLKTFNIAARDSPSTRCNKWVQNMPHSSVWDKEHTLSGHDLLNPQPKRGIRLESRKHRKRHKHRRVERKSSQRSLLMKKIMEKKINMLQSSKQGRSNLKSLEKNLSHKKLHPSASAGRLNSRRRRRDTYDDDSSDDESSSSDESEYSDETPPRPKRKKPSPKASMRRSKSVNSRKKKVKPNYYNSEQSDVETEISDDTVTLKRKARNIVRKVWSQGDDRSLGLRKKQRNGRASTKLVSKAKKIPNKTKSSKRRDIAKMWAVKEAHRAHKKKITKLGQKSLKHLVKRLDRERSSGTCLKSARLREDIKPEQMACMQTSRERKDRRIQERKHEKMRNWLHHKTRNRPKCRYSRNIYTRKHRPGLYITQDRGKASLGWAILQSIKLLERKGVPYPLAILKNMQNKWGYKELNLVQLKQALNWMTKKGILKNDTVREEERYTISKRRDKNKLPHRASFLRNQKEFALDESDTSLDYGIEVGKKKKGPMRVRFQHGARDFTSVKCKKYGTHDAQSDGEAESLA